MQPGQRITREDAIRLYTANGAFGTFSEREKGSLEVGELADLVVLDRDILECPVESTRTSRSSEPISARGSSLERQERTESLTRFE